MKLVSFVKKNPLPVAFISITISFLFIIFNLFNGWLSLQMQTFAQSFASAFQTVVSQSTQNPDYALSYSSSSLTDILMQNIAVKDSLFSLLGLYVLLIAFAALFLFVTLYIIQHFVESYQQKKDVKRKPLLQFILFWLGFFVVYKIIFFFFNLRQVFVSVLTDNSSNFIFIFDKIFLVVFFYFASVSFVLLVKKDTKFIKNSLKLGLSDFKQYGTTYAILLVCLYVLSFVPVQSLPVAFIVILIMSFFIILYIVQQVRATERCEADVSFKHAGYSLGSIFLAGLVVIIISSTFFTIPDLQFDELSIELSADYKEQLRLENTNDIVLLEFVDFSCEYCKASQPLLEQLRSFYSYEEVTIAKRHYLLDESNPDTLRAAMFYECLAQQGGADAASSILFNLDDFSQNSLAAEAALYGLTAQYYESCMTSQELYDIIVSDVIFAKDVGIKGTPAYILVNKQTNETQSFHGVAQLEIMTSVIDSWLK